MIAYPVMISLLMEHLVGMTDTAFLGRVGEVELGAAALAWVYYAAIFMLGFGFSIGAQILISRRNGEGNFAQIGPIFYQGSFFLLLLAGGMFWLSREFSAPILARIVQSPEVAAACVEFLDWRVYGFFFSALAVMFRAFYVGIAYTRVLTYASLVMVGLNVILAYAMIFGKWGFPVMGIGGAAIAASISEGAGLLFYVVFTWRRVDMKKYALDRFVRPSLHLIGRLLSLSSWTMAQYFLSLSAWFIFFLAIEHLGEQPLAVSNVVRNLSMMLMLAIWAFSATVSTLAGNFMGSGESERVLPSCLRIIKLCYMVMALPVLLLAVFPELFLRIYTSDAALVSASVPSLWVMAGSLVFAVPAYLLFSIISGAGNTRGAFLVEIAGLSAYMVYVCAVIFYSRAPTAVCWTADMAHYLVILALSVWYLKRTRWREREI